MADETWEDQEHNLLRRNVEVILHQDENDNVKESWEDEDEEEPKKEPEPQTSAVKDTKEVKKDVKSKTSKSKTDKTPQIDQLQVEERKLTAKELEELQKKSDFENLKDALGITDEQKDALNAFNAFNPSTKDEFKSYSEFLVDHINRHNKKKDFYDFLSDFFRALCVNLDSEHVRRYSKDLAFLATELQKKEKENEKQKQKGSKKPTLAMGRRALDDFADLGDGGYVGEDDEDFM